MVAGACPRSPLPHLNQCLPAPLTEQKERLLTNLEILMVERYKPKIISS